MKKYFMKGTEDELQFGDVIELDFVGEEDGVTKHTHLECKFLPELADELLKEDIIEVRESKGKSGFKKAHHEDDLIDFDLKEFSEAVADDIEELDDRQESLEEKVTELEDRVIELEGVLADLMDNLDKDE